jgi:hypothetical protein
VARKAEPAAGHGRRLAISRAALLGRIRLRTALACSVLTVAVVLVRGGARRRRSVFRHHEHRVTAAMNTWTAVSRSLGLAALILVAVTLPVGLLFGRRLVSVDRRAEVRVMHMTLSMSALAVIVCTSSRCLGRARSSRDSTGW